MSRAGLVAESDRAGDEVRVLAPAVGLWSARPEAGSIVVAGEAIGRLRVLQHEHVVLLPEGAAGRVVGARLPHRTAVEYGQELMRLAPVDASRQAVSEQAGTPPSAADLPEGARAIVAPTDGVFYGRPAPEAPPFVESGQRIRSGQPVGLVEVMKTFNPILYGGAGLPDEVEVLRVCCADGEEIRAGQPLVIVR